MIGNLEPISIIRSNGGDLAKQVMTIASDRLRRLIGAMFDMIRLDTEDELSLVPNQLASVVEAVIDLLKPESEHRGIPVVFEAEPVPLVPLNAAMMERAVQNLVVNALNYTPDSGRVVLRLYQRDSAVVLDVADNGIGIAPHHLPSIFQRFYRVDGARTTRTGGSGLGLAIVHRVVQLHGGTVDVQSTVGVGTTFRIELPLINAGEAVI